MSKEKYYPAKLASSQFHCPHCDVYAKQYWSHLQTDGANWSGSKIQSTKFDERFGSTWHTSKCEHCGEHTMWFKEKMIYPKKILVSQPNKDLQKDIQDDYIEAANVFNESPRAAAALLRLVLQKLCRQLGEKGNNINKDIKNLVKKGLSPHIQKSLDALRITGNNAVHPGKINITEEPERALKLFELINFIAQKMITEPREIDSFYEKLPESSKKAIKKRDGEKKSERETK